VSNPFLFPAPLYELSLVSVFVFLLLSAAVVYLIVWSSDSVLVGRLYYDGQLGFDACWVILCS
jgi:hypothetical protein